MCLSTGYVSRCGSDSDDSDPDMEPLVSLVSCPRVRSSSDPEGRKRKDVERRRNKDGKEKENQPWGDKKKKGEKEEKDADREKDLSDKVKESKNDVAQLEEENDGRIQIEVTDSREQLEKVGAQKEAQECTTTGARAADDQPSASETSDSCRTDSRVLTSPSSDSLDALEEDDLISCSSSSILPTCTQAHSSIQLHPFPPRQSQAHLLAPPPAHSHPFIQLASQDRGAHRVSGDGADPQLQGAVSASVDIPLVRKCSGSPYSDDSSLCFAELTRLVEFLPSPPEASEDDEDEEEELRRRRNMLMEKEEAVGRVGEGGSSSFKGQTRSPPLTSPSSNVDFVFNFDQSDARCYYKLCSSITPDSARSLPRLPNHHEGGEREEAKGDHAGAVELELIPILQPPPGFGDSSSDDEFFDARDGFTSPEDPTSGAVPRGEASSEPSSSCVHVVSSSVL